MRDVLRYDDLWDLAERWKFNYEQWMRQLFD
jgi:hypothetical protein